jgi:hypothetical protein
MTDAERRAKNRNSKKAAEAGATADEMTACVTARIDVSFLRRSFDDFNATNLNI